MFKNIVPIASGKGGVGKSTVSANLALALKAKGLKVGLMDADVYGPSIPTILGITDKPISENGKLKPVEKYGIKVISTAFFVPSNEAVIWRGPMLHKLVQDFLNTVDWGELDILLVDLPPGTGDVQLSLCQSIPVTGAVVVSTPQDVAWNVAQKAILMFDKLNTPVLGVIENMTGEIFGQGGAKMAAQRLELPYLGDVPLSKSIRESGDKGDPSASAKDFAGIADRLLKELKSLKENASSKKSPIKISPAGQTPLEIIWNDGAVTKLDARKLRAMCPCAGCVNEITGQRMIKPESVPADIKPSAINPVGRYALQIVWSDGHSTGLYGFDYLRNMN